MKLEYVCIWIFGKIFCLSRKWKYVLQKWCVQILYNLRVFREKFLIKKIRAEVVYHVSTNWVIRLATFTGMLSGLSLLLLKLVFVSDINELWLWQFLRGSFQSIHMFHLTQAIHTHTQKRRNKREYAQAVKIEFVPF